jgi:hypothetical protein
VGSIEDIIDTWGPGVLMSDPDTHMGREFILSLLAVVASHFIRSKISKKGLMMSHYIIGVWFAI